MALLARIELSPEEEERLRDEMSSILDYVQKLNQLDTENIEPTAQVGESGTPVREDIVTNRPAVSAMLRNAPASERGYFKVPKIIE